MNILFTGVGRRIELIQAFRNAALVLNKNLKIYGEDWVNTAPALVYCDFVRHISKIKDSQYIEDLLRICKEDRINLVIPTIDTGLMKLAENREKFDVIGTKVMISSPEMVGLCRDKNLTSQFFVNCGLHAPMTINDWKEYNFGYPAFIKPKDGSSSINAFKVENEKELEMYAEQVEDYIIQPFIKGKEYTIDIFCDWYGNPVSIVPRERVQVRSGEVLKTKICMDKQIIEEARVLCEKFKPCGPMTAQLIRDKDNIDWFIEINPRYGGGAPLSMKAGARSAETVLKLLDGDKIEYSESVSDEAVYSRFDQSVCVKEGKGKIKGVIFDLDDTLYSEKEYVKSGFKAISDYLGGGYDEKLWQYFETGKMAITKLLREEGRIDEDKKCLEIYRNHMPDIHLYPGVMEMIGELRHKGFKIGIITDGRPKGQQNKIEALGLNSVVDDIIITDELGGKQFRKPCDIAFRIIATRWRLNPSEIVYVADNISKDFQAPQQLGMKHLWFRNKNGLYSFNMYSDLSCVENVSECLSILLNEYEDEV